jgi:hypothetical protein
MTRFPITEKLFKRVKLKTAERFLDILSPHRSGPLWERPDVEGWIFRGQRDASLDLAPSAFRIGDDGNPAYTKFKGAQITEPAYGTLKDQVDHEEAFVLQFASAVSLAGFEVPGDRPELRAPELAIERHDGREFPPIPQRWIYALAQHYGVATRLLDWTSRPLVAAYFAAQGAATRAHQRKVALSERLAVWAVSRPFIEQVASKWDPGPVIVTVPTTSNPNLHAQAGLFTLVRYTKESKKVGTPPTLDALFRRKANRVAARKTPHLIPQPMLFQFTLPVAEAPVLLHYLHLHGIDAAYIYPGLKSVFEAMKESKLRSKVTPGRHAPLRPPPRR